MAGPWESFKAASPAAIDPRPLLDSEPTEPVIERNGRLVLSRDAPQNAAPAASGAPWEAFRAPAPEKAAEPEKPRKADAGVNDAIQRGFMQGLTANWNDELQAIAKAGGATDDVNGIQHLLVGLARLSTGNEEARKI